MQEYFTYIQGFVNDRSYVLYIGAVSAISIFLFWRSVRRTCCKDEDGEMLELKRRMWSRKVFDLLVVSFTTSVVIARLAYFLYNPDLLEDIRWFWIPYERIDGEVFWFASMPWLFMRIWDGGILLEGLILGWLMSIAVYSRIMSIKWGSISNAVADSFWFWFLAVMVYLAAAWNMPGLLGIVVYLLVIALLRFWSNRQEVRKEFLHRFISFVWKTSAILGVPIVMLISNLFLREVEDMEFLLALSGVTIIVGLWILAGDMLEFFNILQTNVSDALGQGDDPEKVVLWEKKERDISDRAQQDWRRFTVANPVPRQREDRESPRDFSRSYRHFSSKWRDTLSVIWARLTRRRKDVSHEDMPPY